jgi:hypothetical protein
MSQGLSNVTLVCIEFQQYELAHRALETTLRLLPPVKEVLVISDKDFYPGSRWVEHAPTESFREYNQLMLKGVAPHVTQGHAMYVQSDSMVHQSNHWLDQFVDYDYIGAPWPNEPEGRNIGNGGFSLRSARFLQACLDPEIQLLEKYKYLQEDACIGREFRPLLEQRYEIKFAPTALAQKFCYELGTYHDSMAIHGVWNILGFARRQTAEYYCERLPWNGWNADKWHHCINALWQRQHIDLLDQALTKLTANQPGLVTQVINIAMRHNNVVGYRQLMDKLTKL